MTILSGTSIRLRCTTSGTTPLVFPFHERTVSHGLTFGLGYCGYDVRVAESIRLDPLYHQRQHRWRHPSKMLQDGYQSFALASTIEMFTMPNDLMARVTDKSTWARCGLAVQNTVLEPGWSGHLTLELSNNSNTPIAILSGMPIAQIIFELLDHPVQIGYTGKYQNQKAGPQPPVFELS